MDIDETIKIEKLKLKVQALNSARQLTVTSLIALIGGVVGLAFLPNNILKFTFIPAGIFYFFCFNTKPCKIKWSN